MHQVPATPARPIARNASESCGDGEARDGFEERPEIGEERELAHEEQQDRRHAERDLRPPSSRKTLPRPGRPRGGSDGMAIHCQTSASERERHHEEEGAAPADDAAEIAAERRRDRRGDGVAARSASRAPCGTASRGRRRIDDRGRHRPEAADRDAEQRAPDHQHQVVRRERDRRRRRAIRSTESDASTTLRSMPRVSPAMKRLVTTAKRPEIEIACPACPSVIAEIVGDRASAG